jgi:hypothetical protein
MRFRWMVFAAATMLVAPAASAADFDAPIVLAKGAVIEIEVRKTVVDTEKGEPSKTTEEVSKYRQTIEPIEGGYRVRQGLLSRSFPGQEGIPGLDFGEFSIPLLTFEAQDTLEPERVVAWPESVDQVAAAAAKLPVTAFDAGAFARRRMAELGEAAATSELIEQQELLSAPQTLELSLGEKRHFESDAAWYDLPVRQLKSVELASVDRQAQRAVVVTSEWLDPKSAEQVFRVLSDGVAEEPGLSEAERAELAEFKMGSIDRSRRCRYDMDMKTGLTAKADCTLVMSLTAGEAYAMSQTTRWVISQTLVKP